MDESKAGFVQKWLRSYLQYEWEAQMMPAVSEKLTATLRALSMLAGVEPQADGGGGSASKVGGSAPKGKGKEGSNDVEWSAKKEARFHKCKVPVQKNGYDCGMFVN
jgi:hypothetical protein